MPAVIDVHTHVVPGILGSVGTDRGARLVRRGDTGELLVDGRSFCPLDRSAWDPPHRAERMAEEGVDRQVLSPLPELFWYDAPVAAAGERCREINGWIADQVARSDGRFEGLGIVPLQAPDTAAAMLDEVAGLGLRGVEVGSNVEGEPLFDERFEPFFAAAERLGLAVLVHPHHPPGFDRFTGGACASAVTFPNEIGFAAGGLVAEGTLLRHPGLRACVTHGGGSLPVLLPRLDRMWELDPSFRERLPVRPSDLARRLFADLLVFDREALRSAIRTFGSDRIVVGSDQPFMPDRAGSLLADPGFTSEERTLMALRNARVLLGLPGERDP